MPAIQNMMLSIHSGKGKPSRYASPRMQTLKRAGLISLALLCLLLSSSCTLWIVVANLERKVLLHDGIRRTYQLYVPASYDGLKPVPLVIALHRFTETGKIMAAMTGFNPIARREGFIVAYPDGVCRRWNTEDGKGVDDYGFLLALVDQLQQDYRIDPARIYVTGASSGGFMAYNLVCRASDVFAAAAPVMGFMPNPKARACQPSRPISLLIVHGNRDPIVPYNENLNLRFMGIPFGTLNVPDTIAFWVAANECAPDPIRQELPDKAPSDGATAFVQTYGGGRDNAEVVVYTIEGGGHTWPGGFEPLPRFIVGRQCMDFEASRAIWDFFVRHPMYASTPQENAK